ncbi:MAG: GNAT family N-acetyltransferase [Pyrinomonadaceae bacterium]
MKKTNAVSDNKQKHQFEMPLDENKLAFIQYKKTDGGVLALTHTEVPEEFEGQGIGSVLVKGMLEIVRTAELKIAPECPFIAAYLQRHPEHQELIATAPS